METTTTQTIQHPKNIRKSQLRDWVTPLTTGSFVLSAVTGLLLLCKVQLGLVKFVHEWLSVLFVIGAGLHVVVNWRPMMRSFSRPRARAILAIFALLICATFLLPGQQRGTIPPAKSIAMFQHSSLAAVAQAADRTPEEAVQLLENQGIHAESSQSIDEIALTNGKKMGQIMGAVFQN